MPALQAVLFDLDNTLYDFSQTWQQATTPLLASLFPGESHNLEDIREEFNHINTVVFRYVDHGLIPSGAGRHMRWELLMALHGLKVSAPELNARHVEAMMQCVPFPDTPAVIAQLAERFALAIITNGPADLMDRRLESIGLGRYFPPPLRICPEVAHALKPDPAIFHEALKRLNIVAEHACYVGDSWEYDILGAHGAGLPCIWFNPEHRPCPDSSLIVAQVDSFPALLQRIP